MLGNYFVPPPPPPPPPPATAPSFSGHATVLLFRPVWTVSSGYLGHVGELEVSGQLLDAVHVDGELAVRERPARTGVRDVHAVLKREAIRLLYSAITLQ